MTSSLIINTVNKYQSNPPYTAQRAVKVPMGENTPIQKDLTLKQKAAIAGSAFTATLPVMAYYAHKSGYSLNPLKILKTAPKNWAYFKCSPIDKAVEYGASRIIALASASVVGGGIGGAIVDKENIKAKKREFLNQIFGNVLAPVGCVYVGSIIFNSVSPTLIKMMPQIASEKKTAKIFNACMKNLPSTVFTLGFLALGIYIGNRVSNLINDKVYHKKVDRNIRPTDFAPHIDDVCMATSMMNKESLFATRLGRVIPFALLVPGYETGVARISE